MKKNLIAITIALSLFVSGAGIAAAKSTPASTVRGCDNKSALVINVTEKIINTVDSGLAGNNWAFDDLNRGIKVYDNGDGTYCAEVTNQGKFDSQAEQQSPGNTGVLTGKEDGTFNGGYQATITGSLRAVPLWQTHGNVGTTDYQCDLNGNCPGYVSWIGQYFNTGYGFAYDFWGWTYNYKNHVWINASTGNFGDVI